MKKIFKIALFCSVVFIVYLGVLYFIQNNILFLPSQEYKSPTDISMPEFSEASIQSTDGITITTWYHQGDKNKPAILFLHGNAGQLAMYAPYLRLILNAGYSVLMMEYRSFGKTKGDISQTSIVQDTALAFDWLKNKGHSTIIVYGYSFGTAFTSALTNVRQVDGVILVAPFWSLEKLVSEKPFPFATLVLKDTYMSFEYLKKYKNPLLIIHGKKDTLIPYHHAQMLFNDAASQKKKIILLENDTHISIFLDQKNARFILDFLKNFH